MKVLILAVNFLFFVHAKCSALETSDDLLKVSLYYEALCPYCFQFITEQLYPGYQKIGSYITLELVPYGNAQRSQINGTWQIECQHGPLECALNKVAGCGLARNLNQAKNMEYANCIEKQSSTKNVKRIVKKCAPLLELSGDEILGCSRGKEGNDILARYGEKTDALRPPKHGVPAIAFNDYHDEKLEEDARENFLGTVCKLLLNKPDACESNDEIFINYM